MKTSKTLQVIMLPTNDKSSHIVFENDDIKKLHLWTKEKGYGWNFQHLYLISDDDIKEGDWSKHSNNDIGQVVNIHDNGLYDMRLYNGEISEDLSVRNGKKIIATTEELYITKHDSLSIRSYPSILPTIHQSDIEWYVSEYNKGNVIKEVDVELDTYIAHGRFNGESESIEIPTTIKLRNDNTIIIKK